ncbi:MAG TPA: hypothetical protein VFW65_14390 [Pseudonocardiaceae bacterium]|nr:hypothetical protein [Pseudonocardiaceae bacterium]
MRGPLDQRATSPSRRPPGGKALTRLLQVLDATGLAAEADLVTSRVPDDVRAELTAPTSFRAALEHPGQNGHDPDNVVTLGNTRLAVVDDLLRPAVAGPQWRSLGPTTIPGGQTYGSSRVNVSGRVAAIAVDPRNGNHILCGAANGGVWESTNRGASWAPRTDSAPTTTVGAIAYDPADPTVVLCGTGEGNWWSYLGAGVLRSQDGGTTWSVLATNPFVGAGFFGLLFDPADHRRVVAATTTGLYTSADGGVSWTRRRTQMTWTITAATSNGGPELLAASNDGIVSSTDGGTTWTAVTLPGSPAGWSRLGVAAAPSNPDVAYVWGATSSMAYLWRRANGTWTAVSPPAGVSVGQAWYDWYVAVAPDRDDQVYVAAIDLYRGDVAGGSWTWTDLSSKTSGDSIHPDQHAIAFDPANPAVVYAGSDGGLFTSPDRGITWRHLNNGLVISEYEYVANDFGTTRWLIGGTQDNGTDRWHGTGDWDHSQDGDGGDVAVRRDDARTVFHTFFGMSPERSGSRADAGSWTGIAPPVPAAEGSLFYPPLEASATTGDTVAIGGDALYVSRDLGASWTRLAYPKVARASAMFVPGPDDVFVGTTGGDLFSTHWNGTGWSTPTVLTSPRSGAYLSDLWVRSDHRRLWVVSSFVGGGRVFRSDDGGITWTDRSPGLPDLPIRCLEVDPRNDSRIWVGADLGVYQSTDAGATWSAFANGLPNAVVGDLNLHPHARVLRAGTRNRGAWEIPVDGWLTQPVTGVQFTGTLAANASGRWFTWGWPATWHVVWTVVPDTPVPGAPQVGWTVEVERASTEYATYWLTVVNRTPRQITFEGRYAILSYY